MALSDILRERVSRRGRTAQVDCGALGTLTVEALPPRECAALGTADGGRALVYAACRELQAAGEALRRERRLYTPDEITQYLSDSEAAAAVGVVLELSGVSDFSESRLAFVQKPGASETENGGASPSESGTDGAGGVSNLDETRLQSVQQTEADGTENREVRLQTVQFAAGADGQNSRETVQFSAPSAGDGAPGERLALPADEPAAAAEKSQTLGYLSENRTQNMGALPEIGQNSPAADALAADPLHETESEVGDGLHETKSEFRGSGAEALHETESEFGDRLHEIKSDFRPDGAKALHEIKSEFRSGGAEALHEIKSEFGDGLHEIKSDFRPDGAKALHETKSEFGENLHETTSELAEQVAQRLLEGLRRAAVAQTGGFS